MAYLYVMGCMSPDGHEVVKIGISGHDPEIRKKSIQTGCPFKIDRIWSSRNIPDARSCETFLHKQLANYRSSGEWFSIPFARACVIADKICKSGHNQRLMSELDRLKSDLRDVKRRCFDIEDDIVRIQEQISGSACEVFVE